MAYRKSRKLSKLSDEQIVLLLEEIPSADEDTGTEDGGDDFSSEDDAGDPQYTLPENISTNVSNPRKCLGDTYKITTTSCGAFNGIRNDVRNDSLKFKSIIWKKKNLQLHVNEVAFLGKSELPAEFQNIKTPYDYFS